MNENIASSVGPAEKLNGKQTIEITPGDMMGQRRWNMKRRTKGHREKEKQVEMRRNILNFFLENNNNNNNS